MVTTSRPKQRVIVRWNDNLDKSLLLFITHICSEKGIKIPYDEIAQRMGSTFTEGAIQQHITKLRDKMADSNEVPVPPPRRRGQSRRTSSKLSTASPRESPSAPSYTPSTNDSHQLPTTVDPPVIPQVTAARKDRIVRREIVTIKIESDDDEEDADEGVEDDDEEGYVAQLSNNLKRKRSDHVQGGRLQGSHVRNVNQQFQARAVEMMRQMQKADDEWEANNNDHTRSKKTLGVKSDIKD